MALAKGERNFHSWKPFTTRHISHLCIYANANASPVCLLMTLSACCWYNSNSLRFSRLLTIKLPDPDLWWRERERERAFQSFVEFCWFKRYIPGHILQSGWDFRGCKRFSTSFMFKNKEWKNKQSIRCAGSLLRNPFRKFPEENNFSNQSHISCKCYNK